jgi:hypothetical protein
MQRVEPVCCVIYFGSFGSLVYIFNSKLSVIIHIIALCSRVFLKSSVGNLKVQMDLFIVTLFFNVQNTKTV